MKQVKTKLVIVLLLILITYVSWNSWYKTTHTNAFVWSDEDKEKDQWVATSRYWLDRKSCRWLFLCGIMRMHLSHYPFGYRLTPGQIWDSNQTHPTPWRDEWFRGSAFVDVNDTSKRNIPDYVLEHAPFVHLFSGEQFWPVDPAEHLYHTTPYLNYTKVESEYRNVTLSNLDELNLFDNASFVYLTSDDNVETRPAWLEGIKNIPQPVSVDDTEVHDKYSQPRRASARSRRSLREGLEVDSKNVNNVAVSPDIAEELGKKAQLLLTGKHEGSSSQITLGPSSSTTRGGRSAAPVILITVPKANGVLDAFWFFFYSFNLGNGVFGFRFGHHVGDWEHTALRFHNGTPQAMYFSAHSWGAAYTYEALEKKGKRPVIYSATGTHAMYPTAGYQPYVLPFNLLHDQTDRGPLWDPILNYHGYTYNYTSEVLLPSLQTPTAPTSWFYFKGRWGDKFYRLSDYRQYSFFGQYHYVSGPQGPKFKQLGRKQICSSDTKACKIKQQLGKNGETVNSRINRKNVDKLTAAYQAGVKFDLR